MALTITQDINTYHAGFGKSIIKIQDTNSNVVRFKVSVKDSASSTIHGSQFVTAFASGGNKIANCDLKGLFSSIVGTSYNPFSNQDTIAVDTTNHSSSIIVNFNGYNIDGQEITSGNTATKRIIKSVDIRYNQWSGGSSVFFPLKTGKDGIIYRSVFPGQVIFFPFYSVESSRILRVNTTGLPSTTTLNGYGLRTYKVPNILPDFNVVTTSVGSSSPGFVFVIDRKKYKRAKTLYFLNKMGGWDWINFIDYEKKTRANKTQHTIYTTDENDLGIFNLIENETTEFVLFGKPSISEYINYVEDIVSSPFVFDETGQRVRVIDQVIPTDRNEMNEIQLTIRYIQSDVINF